ncbi:MAG: carboxypeptidase regulatory-like domain-containing protein [Acidobacteriia bacterium]|nr:carboxypeptidase regulatory-like domain-containing protein [Terriglobia bacterium]
MRTFMARACLTMMVLVGMGALAFAQATARTSVTGVVYDQTKAVIPGVQITVTEKATGASRSAITDGTGTYRIDLLPAGLYAIKVTMKGFATITSDNVQLLVGQTADIDFTMSPGAESQTITVTEEAPLIDSTSSSVSQNITPQEVQNLPLNGRDFANLAILAPGAKPVDSYDPTKNRIAVFGINGSSGRNVNVTVNGIDDKDNTVGGPVMQLPLGAVQEFIISTQRFSAANGRSEGAAVNVITKSGGNQFHGYGFLFERNERLNANDFFSIQAGNAKPPFSRQQFGGSIGGPIRKDKDFFFFSLERQRENTNIPVTAQAFAELSLVTSLGAQPVALIPTPYRDWRWNARIDHHINQNNTINLAFSQQTNRGLNDQSTQTNDLTAGNFTTNALQLASLTLNSVISTNLVNNFTAGFQYWNNVIDTDKKVPTVTFPGGITFGTNTNVPQQSYQRKWQFRDDLSIIHGKHNFKTGFDYLWEPTLGGFFEFNPTLEIDFLDLPSVITSNKTLYPQGFATPGAVIGMSNTSGNPYFNLQGGAKMFGMYFQDDWKVTRNLTVNLGLRWDKDFNLIGTNAQPLNRTFQELKAINNPYAARLPKDDNKDFSPRVGFAWDITGNGKQTLRGGYGIYYGQTFLNIPLFMIQQINPTVFAVTLSIASAGLGDPNADIVPGTGIKLSNWRFGIDPLPINPPPPTSLPPGSTGRLMDPDYHNPYSQQWNMGYSFELTPTSVVEVEYIHELGLRESKTFNANPKIAANGGARPLSAAFAAAGVPVLSRVDVEQSVGRSRYDGLNISYRKRMTHHFTLNTNYVLSRALAYNGNTAAFRNRPTDFNHIFGAWDLGPTPNDERHRWVLSGVLDLPWGFQISPIMQLASARPYTAIQGIDVFGWGTGRGNAHAFVPPSDPTNFLAFASASASTLRACLAAGTCMQSGFDNVRGQAFFQLDTRVSKSIRLGESKRLNLIWQMFDVTNRANFGNNFDGNIRDASFRQPINFITSSGVTVPHSFSGELGIEFIF